MKSGKNKNSSENAIKGITLSPGIAIGKAFHLHEDRIRNIPRYDIGKTEIPDELQRIEDALKKAKDEIANISRAISPLLRSQESSIFKAQKLMVKDFELGPTFEKEITEKLVNAEQIVREIFRKNIVKFRSFNDEVFRAKADDLIDIYRIVMLALVGGSEKSIQPPENAILLMTRLLPSSPARVVQSDIAGVIIKEGCIYSHGALIVRAMGIPCFCTNGQPLYGIKGSTDLVIDGPGNKVVLNPSVPVFQAYRLKKEKLLKQRNHSQNIIRDVVTLKGGRRIQFMANANTLYEVQNAKYYGCDGIGLIRLEVFYSQFAKPPNEETIYDYCESIALEAECDTITFRLLDMGGDKKLPCFPLQDEKNPSLGMRGVRLLINNPEILTPQINALLRLSGKYPVRILIPMITTVDEVKEVRRIIDKCQRAMMIFSPKYSMHLGVMVETPAAALTIGSITEVADFVSIGTNDLIQYTMAACREDQNVAHLFSKGFEYIYPLIQSVASVCNNKNMECGVCGEIASDEQYLMKLIQCGISQFSVPYNRIPNLKNRIKNDY